MDYLTVLQKYAPFIAGFFLVYYVANWINYKRLQAKFGAKDPINTFEDGFFGFKVGYELLQHKNNGTLVDFLVDNLHNSKHPEIGTIVSTIVGKTSYITKDPENIKAMLGTQFNDFVLGKRHAHMSPLLGDGIFTLDGEGWKHSRTMLRPQFAREQVAQIEILESHVQKLFKHVRHADGKPFDIQKLFFNFTVDTSTQFLFGESVRTLEDASIGYPDNQVNFDGRQGFADAFNRSQAHISNRVILQDFYWLYNPSDFKQSNAAVHNFANYYVKRALQFSDEELDKFSKSGYVFLYELAKQTKNPVVLRNQLLNILVAGRDTTAGLLSFTVFELARNPQVFKKLQEEVWEHFGKGSDAKIEDITFETLKKCEYLKAVINEALRLYPSVPQNFRCANKVTTLPRGGGPEGLDPILLSKGQMVFYSVSATQRDPQYYGKDADVFRPERWFEPETRKLGWAFLPFNGGPRICLGQQFALTETSYVIVRLLQNFYNIESFDTEYPPRKSSHLTMCLQNGCNISLK